MDVRAKLPRNTGTDGDGANRGGRAQKEWPQLGAS
jgi:hypothetical protein